MFKINEFVIYNSLGVYKVVDIRREIDISNNETEYYILQPAYGNNLTIKTPVNSNPKRLMRQVLSKDAALSLIKSIPGKETTWIKDDKQRNVSFKAALRTGESEQWVGLVKAIYIEQQQKASIGKKLNRADEDIMKAAEKVLNEEFAVALNITPDEVVTLISKQVS